MLGKRDSTTEHEAMRKIKNEFMSMWDGLTTNPRERVVILGATNRPFDLDDAVLRRMPRRILVDLPDQDQRLQILKILLREEPVSSNVDLERLASLLDGYSGSDIKNVCVAAAYYPIREIVAHAPKEFLMRPAAEDDEDDDESKSHAVRPLEFADFERAIRDVPSSTLETASAIAELRKWNATFGEGAQQQGPSLSYFM
jgi:SpoVK/Ycf46/Vps4 family AAA+-type ATPase